MKQFFAKMRTVKGLNIHYALIQAMYWVASASLYGYLVVFLQGRGFSTSEIGLLNSARTGIAIFAQLFFAFIGDRFKHRVPLKYMISVAMVFAIVANFALQLTRPGFVGVLILLLVLGATECSIVSLMDSLAIQFMNCGVPVNYSVCRSCGSGAYAIACVLVGIGVDLFSVELTVIVHGIAMILYVILVVTFMTCHMPKRRNTNNARYESYKDKKSGAFKDLLVGNPQYRYMLIANIFVCFGFWPCSNFMANIIQEAGGSNGMYGVYMFLASFLEMPMLAFIFPRLVKKFAPEKLLAFSAVGHLVRWILVGIAGNPYLLVLLAVFQVFSYAISLPAAVYYVNDNISEENKIKGQTFYNISGSIGGTLGTAVFGTVLETHGSMFMYLSASAFIAVGVLFMFKMLASAKSKTPNQEAIAENN